MQFQPLNSNPNFQLYEHDIYNQIPSSDNYDRFVNDCLEASNNDLRDHFKQYSNICAVRLVLKVPYQLAHNNDATIERFAGSLNCIIQSDLRIRQQGVQKPITCNCRVIWCKDIVNGRTQYQTVLLLNFNAYNGIVGKNKIIGDDITGFIYDAWSDALLFGHEDIEKYISYPAKPISGTCNDSSEFQYYFESLFTQSSSLSKIDKVIKPDYCGFGIC